MNSKVLTTCAKILNVLLIILNLAVFIYLRMLNESTLLVGGSNVYHTYLLVMDIWKIASCVILVLSLAILIYMSTKLGINSQGVMLLVGSAAASTVFAFIGFMFGWIIWILSGFSLTKLTQGDAESSFRDKLRR